MRSWTTLNLPAREQYSYWREVICLAYTVLDPVTRSRKNFESSVTASDIAGVTVSETTSKAQTVIRGGHEIRRLMSEEFYVILQLAGHCSVKQHNRETVVSPGEFVMVDAAERFELGFEDFDILCFTVPHSRLLPLIRSADGAVAVRRFADGGLGSITRSYMQSLKGASEAWPEQVKEVTTSHLINLLAMNFGPEAEAQERGRESAKQGLKLAIDRYIDSSLANPQLSVAMVAGRFHLSPRSLHRLFEETGTSFTQSVLDKRLQRAASLLRDKARELPVSEVAYRSGFGDLSHFCKTFSRRYGVSAGRFRLLPEELIAAMGRPDAVSEALVGAAARQLSLEKQSFSDDCAQRDRD